MWLRCSSSCRCACRRSRKRDLRSEQIWLWRSSLARYLPLLAVVSTLLSTKGLVGCISTRFSPLCCLLGAMSKENAPRFLSCSSYAQSVHEGVIHVVGHVVNIRSGGRWFFISCTIRSDFSTSHRHCRFFN